MLFMGLDVGTTGAKACLFSEDGEMKGYGFEEYAVSCPAPGHAEQDATAVFEAVKRVMGQAAQGSGDRIAAIGLSVQGDAVMPLGADSEPLCPVQLGMDYRCKPDADAFEQRFGARELFARTGMRPHPINSLAKIRNITRTRPDVADKAALYATYADYILMKLGSDEPVIDLTMATRTMGMDARGLTWAPDLLAFAGIDAAKLSKPVPSGVRVGTINGRLADELGISRAAKLVSGGHDQTCAALGAGLVKPGLALDSHGTAEVVSSVLPAFAPGEPLFYGHFPCYAHTVAGKWFTFSLNHTAGILLKWFVEGFCGGDLSRAEANRVSPYAYVLSRAKDAPSNLLVLPYFSGKGTPDCDFQAKGMIMGLTLSSTRYDVARAILEALGFDLRENLEALNTAGIGIHSLRCVGGGARSEAGLQLKADIVGMPVHTLKIREAACLGAALLAGIGVGAYRDAAQAAQVVKPDKAYEPIPANSAQYGERYELYRQAYAINRKLLGDL